MARFALLDDNLVITNIIELHPSNTGEFPNSVLLGDIPAGIGDHLGKGGFFTPEGRLIRSSADELAALQEEDSLKIARSILDGTYEEATTDAAGR